MQSVAIVGVGLIGGSFGLALRRAGFTGRIVGVSSERSISAAIARGAIDSGAALEEAVGTCDLIYLARPISGILDVLPKLAPHVRPGTFVTDAGSTKRAVMEQARNALRGALFVGGHPMAGKESRGAENSDAQLFRARPYLLCAASQEGRSDSRAIEFEEWTRRIGAIPRWLTAEEHDRLVAASSHSAQILSTVLASVLARRADSGAVAAAAGPGLIDMTRLALSTYDVWRDILATNSDEIESVLREIQAELARVSASLNSQEMRDNFETGAGFASRLRNA